MSNEPEVIEVRTSPHVDQELHRIANLAGVTVGDVICVALATWMLRHGVVSVLDQEQGEAK